MLRWMAVVVLGCARFTTGTVGSNSNYLETFQSGDDLQTFQGDVYLETFQSGTWVVAEDTSLNLTLSLGFNGSTAVCNVRRNLRQAQLVVTVVLEEDWKLDFVNMSAHFTAEEVCAQVNKSLTFSGYYWGVTKLAFFLTRNDVNPYFSNATLLSDDLTITVDRMTKNFDTAFTYILSVLVVFNNIFLGTQLDLEIIMSVLKRPIGPVCGFVSQFTCMPVVTYGLVLVLFTDPVQRLGLFLLGCSPGGIFSNLWALIFDADINLSVTMTTISIIAAMGMMPLWMTTLGTRLIDDNTHLYIPFKTLAVSLVSLTGPIVIGMLIRWKKESWVKICDVIIKPFSAIVIMLFIAVGTYNSYKGILLMTWQTIVAGMLMLSCGYTFGATLARIMCLGKKQIVAVSLETAIQNTPVTLIILKLSLPSPYSDLASVPVIATFTLTGFPLFCAYLIYCSLRRFCGCCPDEDQPENLQQSAQEDIENSRGEISKFLPGVEKINGEQ
ncbi:ileal sodium/bile acid cotransporter-like [Procambarus clarkii]|uniref:ileal sodium/bile acid cotransporter-like n=1 Tax=Procambarus clarkii TaxID=6728 RepID=UPI001E677A80|nr:ileal sodium/bile acid cotransporter-like [Procambarus clarkii]